eukprot:557060-Prymnesium_polylepis.1
MEAAAVDIQPEESAAAADAAARPTPTTYSASLTHAQLKDYLANKFAGLEKCVLPHTTGLLLLRMQKDGMEISRAFSKVPEDAAVQLLELELLLSSHNKAQAVSDKELAKAAAKAKEKEDRHVKLQ